MNRLVNLWFLMFLLPSQGIAQHSVEQVLLQIKKNNTTLSALRKSVSAEKIGNKTGFYLQNPEIEFNHLWGNPSAIGNRTDVSIIQTFDFPSVYGYKNQIAKVRNQQLDFEYERQLRALIFESRLICYDLVYTNALLSEFEKRLMHAENIAASWKTKFEIGETNVIEYNKSQMNLLKISKDMEAIILERDELLGALTRLNGGISIEFTDTAFVRSAIPVDFEIWFQQAEQRNPWLNWLKSEIEISKKQLNLNKSMSLPKFHAGYMSEKVVGEQFQGVTVGASIPLWENKNTVKYARAYIPAVEELATDNKVRLYSHLKTLHAKVTGLQNSVYDYRSKLKMLNNSALLRKALDQGEISLIDYMLELSIYYESENKLLEMEKTLGKAMAELEQYL
ncbi:MAG: TolC family protein [Lentimicrobium sp.]|nr:TolC family protein [Lentimicrobium sp.]